MNNSFEPCPRLTGGINGSPDILRAGVSVSHAVALTLFVKIMQVCKAPPQVRGDDFCVFLSKQVRPNPDVRPYPNNTPRQYHMQSYTLIYLSQDHERKHWLYAAILTLGARIYIIRDLGFLGF